MVAGRRHQCEQPEKRQQTQPNPARVAEDLREISAFPLRRLAIFEGHRHSKACDHPEQQQRDRCLDAKKAVDQVRPESTSSSQREPCCCIVAHLYELAKPPQHQRDHDQEHQESKESRVDKLVEIDVMGAIPSPVLGRQLA